MKKTITTLAFLLAVGLSYDMSPVSYNMAPSANYDFEPVIVEEVEEVKPEPKAPEVPKKATVKTTQSRRGWFRRRR